MGQEASRGRGDEAARHGQSLSEIGGGAQDTYQCGVCGSWELDAEGACKECTLRWVPAVLAGSDGDADRGSGAELDGDADLERTLLEWAQTGVSDALAADFAGMSAAIDAGVAALEHELRVNPAQIDASCAVSRHLRSACTVLDKDKRPSAAQALRFKVVGRRFPGKDLDCPDVCPPIEVNALASTLSPSPAKDALVEWEYAVAHGTSMYGADGNPPVFKYHRVRNAPYLRVTAGSTLLSAFHDVHKSSESKSSSRLSMVRAGGAAEWRQEEFIVNDKDPIHPKHSDPVGRLSERVPDRFLKPAALVMPHATGVFPFQTYTSKTGKKTPFVPISGTGNSWQSTMVPDNFERVEDPGDGRGPRVIKRKMSLWRVFAVRKPLYVTEIHHVFDLREDIETQVFCIDVVT